MTRNRKKIGQEKNDQARLLSILRKSMINIRLNTKNFFCLKKVTLYFQKMSNCQSILTEIFDQRNYDYGQLERSWRFIETSKS